MNNNNTPTPKTSMCNACYDKEPLPCKVEDCINYGKDTCQCKKCTPTPKEWESQFDENFTLEENGCSDCITESLFYKGKTCYDLNELKSFISKTISQEKEKWKKENEKYIRHLFDFHLCNCCLDN